MKRRSTYQGSKVEVTSSSRSDIFKRPCPSDHSSWHKASKMNEGCWVKERRPSKNQSFFLRELPSLEVRWSCYVNSRDNHPHKKKLWISKCQHIRLSQTKSDLGDVGYQWKDGARIKEARSKLHLQVEVASSGGQAKTKVFFVGVAPSWS